MSEKRIRVLIAKPGLDGHDVGAKVVAHALRDAGMEVVYTGLHQTVEQILSTALQEDVDVIGLSILSGTHLPIAEKLMAGLRREKAEDILVIIGGNIPKRDHDRLKAMGIAGIFPTSTHFEKISDFIKAAVNAP